jgi:single-stranded-DNA-specific exonuclease
MLPTRKKVFDLYGEAGVNADGIRRQDELLRCQPGERVELRRELDNADDPNAILVLTERDVRIGQLERDDAALLAPAIDAGRKFEARLHCLRGGLPDYPNYGARISIAWDGRPPLGALPLDDAQAEERRRRLSRLKTGGGKPGRLARMLTGLARGLPGV